MTITSTLVYTCGVAFGALGYFMWFKFQNKQNNKYYFLRKENKKCQLCFNKKLPYICENSFCSYDLVLKIVAVVEASKKYVFLCIPFLEIEEISVALINAFNRGVDVRIINSTIINNPPKATLSSLASGIPFKSLDVFSIMMHNKFLVTDDKTLLRSSLNYTFKCFTGNYENFLISQSPFRASWYYDYFIQMWNDNHPWHPTDEIRKKVRMD